MTTRLSIVLALLIIVLVTIDIMLLDGENLLFLAKKLTDLIEYLAFWR